MQSSNGSVVTYFDESSWAFWGLSWLASLYEFGNFKGGVIVVDFGMPQKARTFLDQLGVTRLQQEGSFSAYALLNVLAEHAKTNQGNYAFWDHVCYFQGPLKLDNPFTYRLDPTLQPIHRPLIESFGYDPNVAPDASRVYASLVRVAKRYGSLLAGDVFSATSDQLIFFKKFIDMCNNIGFINVDKAPLSLMLNVFALSFPFDMHEDTITSGIDSKLQWNGDGFYNGKHKPSVIVVPANMQYSADSAPYHFRNRFATSYEKWVSYFRGGAFAPKRVLKFHRLSVTN